MANKWTRKAGWWAADYSHVLYWQGRAALNRTKAPSMRDGGLPPVLFIPGIYEPWRFMLPIIGPVATMGHPVHVVPALKLNIRPITDSATIVGEYLEANDLRDVIIVAHSKGGLIGKHVMVHPGSAPRVRAMIAIATPFKGSVYARFMLAPSLRIFHPHDETIRLLHEDSSVNARIVSIFGAFDPHIPAGSELTGAKNVELDTGGHFRILDHPQILAELAELTSR